MPHVRCAVISQRGLGMPEPSVLSVEQVMYEKLSPEKIITLDTETDILCPKKKSKASSFYVDNFIVYCGYRRLSDFTNRDVTVYQPNPTTRVSSLTTTEWSYVSQIFDSQLIVGQNIKFDLLYLRKHYNELYTEWVKNGGCVYDTQVAEYLLSGQATQYASLDYLSHKYGGTLKDDKIKEYWNNGINTRSIPLAEIVPYLKNDVLNTETVYLRQMKDLLDNGMMPLFESQMDCLLALTEMEYNGMYFDMELAGVQADVLRKHVKMVEDILIDFMRTQLPDNIKGDVTPGSTNQVACILWGGNVKVKEQEKVLGPNGLPMKYKSGARKGQVKTKNVEYDFQVHPVVVQGTHLEHPALTASGKWATDDASLKKLLATKLMSHPDASLVKAFIDALLDWRKVNKDLTTYYEGYASEAWSDGHIHANFNQTATNTGRLSCNKPNLQNLSKKESEE